MGSTNVQDINVDVAIIGGGPTGLLTGYLLEQLGVSVSIIDAKDGPLKLGRADALNARTQQVLEVAGVLDELLPQGITCNTSSTFGDGEFKSRQSEWWTGLEHCYRKNFLMLGQPVVESVLHSRFKSSPVIYGDSVVSIQETAEGGVVTKTSQGRTIHSKYALGADGARSSIRAALGVSFTGTKPEMEWAVLDTFIDTDFPIDPERAEITTFQLNNQSRVSWIPRERNMARFYVLLDGGEITQERTEESIRQHLAPHRVDFKRTEWFSTFDVKERIASTFISAGGRIFLGGDAAHVHSVNGGQGLNTGIADAFALAWRLATVVNTPSLSPEVAGGLLRSYDVERRTVAQGVIDVAAALVRDTVHTAKQYVSTIQRNAGFITGMGVSYEDTGSPLVCGSSRGIWIPGKRCPDLTMKSLAPEGGDKRLYSTVSYGKPFVILVGNFPFESDLGDSKLRHMRLVAPGTSKDGQGSVETLETEYAAGAEGSVVVIRPDMYIGFVGGSHAEAEAYLKLLG